MSIQPVSSTSSLWDTIKTDFQALKKNLAAAQNAQKSGAQDQVTISQDALQKALTAFQGDISGLQNSSNGAVNNTTADTSSSSPVQKINQDIAALQNVLQSGDQSQIQNAESALQNDLSGLQKGHHHHHHHQMANSAAAQGYANSGSAVSGPTATANTGTQSPVTINVINLKT